MRRACACVCGKCACAGGCICAVREWEGGICVRVHVCVCGGGGGRIELRTVTDSGRSQQNDHTRSSPTSSDIHSIICMRGVHGAEKGMGVPTSGHGSSRLSLDSFVHVTLGAAATALAARRAASPILPTTCTIIVSVPMFSTLTEGSFPPIRRDRQVPGKTDKLSAQRL